VRALTRGTRAPRAGFTLVEALVAVVVAALLLGSIGLTVKTGGEEFRQGVTVSVLEARAHRAVERIAAELLAAGADTLSPAPNPPLGSSTLEFRVCTGWSGTATTWGPTTRIERVADPRDPQDGVDNDHDGLVDEGQVVLTRDAGGAGEIRAVLADGVPRYLEGETANSADDNGNGLRDEAGLSFARDAAGTLTIRLTLQARDPHGQLMARTVQTAVCARN
jgi:type II secretory pathway pseudopilin PulG